MPKKDNELNKQIKPKAMDAQGRIPGVKYMATDAQMRDYERNKPVNTPAGRARYADAAPDIKPRQAEGESKLRFAVGGPDDVETRELRTERRIAETETRNLNESYRQDKPKAEGAKGHESHGLQEKMQERVKKYKKDPYGDA